VAYRSAEIRIQLLRILQAGDEAALVKDPGWLEYVLAIENTGRKPLTIRNVKLLNLDGRYLDSAASYDQITSSPDVPSEVAGHVARSAASVAAGQVIPYGGSVVAIISGVLSADAAENAASAGRDFEYRKLKTVELAPGGKATGSAFLPFVTNAKALVVDWSHGGKNNRTEIPLPRQRRDR
jgi:hypothetical protein